MNHFFKTSLSPLRTLGVVTIYAALLAIAFWLAFELRFEFQVPGSAEGEVDVNWQAIRVGILPWLVLV